MYAVFLSDLYTLFNEIFAHPRLHVRCVHSSNDGLEGSVDCGDTTATLHGHIKVVGEGTGRHLKNIVRGLLIEENLTEGGDERPRGTSVNRTP